MNKKMSILFLSAFLILGACSKDKEETKKTTTTENATEQTEGKDKGEENIAPVETKSEAELASELVLKNTKLVKIFSINQRMHESYKELGPFYFIRGVDEKGRKTEVWVNKDKIYEIK
jgi:protein involved in sex pheromone biosynthesis